MAAFPWEVATGRCQGSFVVTERTIPVAKIMLWMDAPFVFSRNNIRMQRTPITSRYAVRTWPLALLALVLTACGATQSVATLGDVSSSISSEDEAAADQLIVILNSVNQVFSVQNGTPTLIAGGSTPAQAQASLKDQLGLADQPAVFVQALAQHGQQVPVQKRPMSVVVAATEVRSARGAAAAHITLVTVNNTYSGDPVSANPGAPEFVTSTLYAVEWSTSPNGVGAVQIDQILPVYADAQGNPALDSGSGRRSTKGIVLEYVSALAKGDDASIDSFEGVIATSPELRATLKTALSGNGRITVVELPDAQAGATRIVYGVLTEDQQLLRFDVTETDGDLTVVGYLA